MDPLKISLKSNAKFKIANVCVAKETPKFFEKDADKLVNTMMKVGVI